MRHFSVEEAGEALAEVGPLMERLVARYRELRSGQAQLAAVRARIAGNGGGLQPVRMAALEQALAVASSEIATGVGRLEELGVQLKDLETGLVDFPAVHPETGETVLLCWRVGEDAIAHWHGLDEGFAGRKPLPF
jgi:hypothetical protein